MELKSEGGGSVLEINNYFWEKYWKITHEKRGEGGVKKRPNVTRIFLMAPFV